MAHVNFSLDLSAYALEKKKVVCFCDSNVGHLRCRSLFSGQPKGANLSDTVVLYFDICEFACSLPY